GQECPPHTISSYLNPQKFLENKSCDHRQDEKQPDPIHSIACDFDITIVIVDRNRISRTILRQRRLVRREHPLPKVSTQADGRNSREVCPHTNSLGHGCSRARSLAGGDLYFVFSLF